MRHKLYIRAFFNQEPLCNPANGDYFPPEPAKVLDLERNEVISPKGGVEERALMRMLYRAMTMGWKSFAPYS